MKTSDQIRNMFDSFEPEMISDEEFMDKLSKNLDAVEIFKRREEKQIDIFKSRMFWTIIGGIIAAIVIVLIATILPSSWPPIFNIVLTCISESMLCFGLVLANHIRSL